MNSDFAIGLHIVGFLTARQGAPLTSETLASTYGTSPVVVRRLLGRLQRAGLVETRRGAGGGSVLARPPSEVNLRQVYEAVAQNPQLLGRHPIGEGPVATVLGTYINELYDGIEEALLAELATITVERMDATVRPRILSARCRKKP